jgi:hypothetical protein
MSDDLVALGKQNGAVIADYVVSRMQAGSMSPAQAVEALAAYLAKRIDELKASGIPEERLVPWVGAVQKAFDERLEQLAGPDSAMDQALDE